MLEGWVRLPELRWRLAGAMSCADASRVRGRLYICVYRCRAGDESMSSLMRFDWRRGVVTGAE